MTARRRPAAPMPAELRHFMRAGQHPARAVPCPHCRAAAHKPCALRTTGQRLPQPHPQRISAWAQATARCPACQAAPGAPCHDDGRHTTTHTRRYQEAEATAA
ncbi:zinc finger domain-containing protein [Streptomyces uncialis]|uniref:DNA-binding phage zinc finger domain-containing protein n=1 Tax=Streptomyces uncialis TaxID=1048205 RepID=A0A1Q4V0V6_9ACTN|nr:hypothetical protein [Streptomyces uncialis]OKH91463.1 hypothetical protein AB852_28295 [Streptomyces uncialis]